MIITVSKVDIAKAIESHQIYGGPTLCNYCPVWQALRRYGIPVAKVFLRDFVLVDGTPVPLPEEARKATHLATSEWRDMPNFQFEIPEVK